MSNGKTYKILPSKYRSAKQIENLQSVKLGIEQTTAILPLDKLNAVVNEYDLFVKERNLSEKYRFYGDFILYASNPLMNINPVAQTSISGKSLSELDCLNPMLCNINEDSTIGPRSFNLVTGRYEKTREQTLIEKDGWFGYITDSDSSYKVNCVFNYMEPTPNRFYLIKDTGVKNWELAITYPAAQDDTIPFRSGNVDVQLSAGLPIVHIDNLIVGGKNMTIFYCPINHGLKKGDEIRLFWSDNANISSILTYNVVQLGDASGRGQNFSFALEIDSTGAPIVFDNGVYFNRVVDGEDSVYYSRLFKKLLPTYDPNDFDMHKTSFSRNMYGDKSFTFVNNLDYDLKGLVDNLNRPLSQVYYSYFKKSDSGFWNLPVAGLQTYFKEINDLQFDKNGIRPINSSEYDYEVRLIQPTTNLMVSNFTLTRNIKKYGSSSSYYVESADNMFYGDICEYNTADLEERTLQDFYHRINTLDREVSNCNEGYYYKPYYRLDIREFSSDIEFADPNTTIDVPSYAITTPNGLVKWRDLLDKGYFNENGEGIIHPFTNDYTYAYNRINFVVKRQDPFNYYNLDLDMVSYLYNSFDPDPDSNVTAPVPTNDFDVRSTGCYRVDGISLNNKSDIIPIDEDC